MTEYPEAMEPGDAWEAADERFLELLSARLVSGDTDDLLLGNSTVDALDAHAEPSPISAKLQLQLARIGKQAEIDVQFLASLSPRRQQPTLGTYVAFLRRRAELTVTETAKRLRLEFQWLADLERDALSPALISARKLEQLVKRLKGSLEMTEQVLASTIQAPRFLSTGGRDSLYRRGAPSSQGLWTEPPDRPSLQENPEYHEQAEALAQLREQLRASWRP